MNNNGVYHGLTSDAYTSKQLASLPPTALLPNVKYEQFALACGGHGHLVRTPDELSAAVKDGLACDDNVTVVNVLMDTGKGGKLEFGWLNSTKKESKL